MCRVIVRCRAITRATTSSSDFSNTPWHCAVGIFAIEVHHVLAEEDVVVVLVTVKAERNGRSAAFPEVHVWRLANEKVTEFREFQGDEQTEDRFWS